MLQVDRKKIGFTENAWEANLELEAFLEKPAAMKELIEKKTTVTGAQAYQLHFSLKMSCKEGKPLTIKVFPETLSVKDRVRKTAQVESSALSAMVVEGRKEMIAQLDKRFFSTPPSDPRLVQIWMSKQLPATKCLPEGWQQIAEAHYLKYLRETADVIDQACERTSPRLKAKKRARTSAGFFDGCASDDNELAQEAVEDDKVTLEIALWKGIDTADVKAFMDVDGLVDEFAFIFSVREKVPIHFALFKRLAADLPHEANAESTFSLSGSLSNDNKCSRPDALSTFVRINKNKAIFKPTPEATYTAYRSKFGKVCDTQHEARKHAYQSMHACTRAHVHRPAPPLHNPCR
jgi:hypothetical protein